MGGIIDSPDKPEPPPLPPPPPPPPTPADEGVVRARKAERRRAATMDFRTILTTPQGLPQRDNRKKTRLGS